MSTAKYAIKKLKSSREAARHDYHNVFMKCVRAIEETKRIEVPKARVLVLGCGYNYPDVLLWSAISSFSVGVDTRGVFWKNGFFNLCRDYGRAGNGLVNSFARTALTRGSYWRYYDFLKQESGTEFEERHPDVVIYDGTRLPFADGSFDVVCSNAVLEHVSDVARVSAETARVTKDSGVCYHVWHNYYALSGAHVPEELARASPWGHLLGDSDFSKWLSMTGTQLNRLTPREMLDAFSNDFEVLRVDQIDRHHRRKDRDDGFEWEGADLLSPELQTRLRQWDRQVLLTRAYSFLGVPRNHVRPGHGDRLQKG